VSKRCKYHEIFTAKTWQWIKRPLEGDSTRLVAASISLLDLSPAHSLAVVWPGRVDAELLMLVLYSSPRLHVRFVYQRHHSHQLFAVESGNDSAENKYDPIPKHFDSIQYFVVTFPLSP